LHCVFYPDKVSLTLTNSRERYGMSKLTEQGVIIKGFKATSKAMKCLDHQFKIGEWYETDGEIELCSNGFHFCPHMSGVWSYYPTDSRVFEVEAEMVLIDYHAGAELKYSAKRIRLVKEVKIGGYSNTGDRNTGNSNTGDWNATDRCSGMFCQNAQYVKSFDVQTKLTYEKFMEKYYDLFWSLASDLREDEPFDYKKYKTMPGWTLRKIKSLHKKHIEGRV